jgi:hypothetical protein
MGIETNREIAGTEAGLSVSSRVGGSIADCGGELTGPVATNNLQGHTWA